MSLCTMGGENVCRLTKPSKMSTVNLRALSQSMLIRLSANTLYKFPRLYLFGLCVGVSVCACVCICVDVCACVCVPAKFHNKTNLRLQTSSKEMNQVRGSYHTVWKCIGCLFVIVCL